MDRIDITRPSPDYTDRQAAAAVWLGDPAQAGDAYETAKEFTGRYGDCFWMDVDTVFDAAREDDGPLASPFGVTDMEFVQERSSNGDTYGVVILIGLDSGLTLATRFLEERDLVSGENGGLPAAAEALATIHYEVEKTLRGYPHNRPAAKLADEASAELESGVVTDRADRAFLDGVRQVAAYLAFGEVKPGSELAALLDRMRRADG